MPPYILTNSRQPWRAAGIRKSRNYFVSSPAFIALDAETAGYEYYKNVLETTYDLIPEIKALVKEFVEEEAGHVAELAEMDRRA